ncbi:unnamed protein product [Cunninghamella blakesleeana]
MNILIKDPILTYYYYYYSVARIMKKSLPDNAKIAKEAKECVQMSSDKCQQEKRKTINGEDILWAMQSLGFENYAEALKIYLGKYRETTKIDRNAVVKEKEEEIQQPTQQIYGVQQPGEHPGQSVSLPGSIPQANYYNAMAGHPYMDQKN